MRLNSVKSTNEISLRIIKDVTIGSAVKPSDNKIL